MFVTREEVRCVVRGLRIIAGVALVYAAAGAALAWPVLVWADDKSLAVLPWLLGPTCVGLVIALAWEVGQDY